MMDREFVEVVSSHLPFLNGRTLTASSSLRELGLDSMRSIDLLFALEDTFGASLPDEDLNDATFATAGSLWQALNAARTAAGAAGTTETAGSGT
ncbi:phosphopantetheine-binding protein [Streptomyces sp. NPDC001658]